MKFAQGLFAETITAAEACIGANANPYPNLYGLLAYANFKIGDKLEKAGDSSAAMAALWEMQRLLLIVTLQKQKPAKIGSKGLFYLCNCFT